MYIQHPGLRIYSTPSHSASLVCPSPTFSIYHTLFHCSTANHHPDKLRAISSNILLYSLLPLVTFFPYPPRFHSTDDPTVSRDRDFLRTLFFKFKSRYVSPFSFSRTTSRAGTACGKHRGSLSTSNGDSHRGRERESCRLLRSLRASPARLFFRNRLTTHPPLCFASSSTIIPEFTILPSFFAAELQHRSEGTLSGLEARRSAILLSERDLCVSTWTVSKEEEDEYGGTVGELSRLISRGSTESFRRKNETNLNWLERSNETRRRSTPLLSTLVAFN